MSEKVLVGIIMGSQSDWDTMKHAADALESLGVAYETKRAGSQRVKRESHIDVRGNLYQNEDKLNLQLVSL